jgi:glutamate 5-kinase
MKNENRKKYFSSSRRIVVKVGSGVLTGNNELNIKAVQSISRQISDLVDQDREVILVSSGAMASGLKKIGLENRPDGIPQQQAVAAVGQTNMILEWEKEFKTHGKKVAQILLTSDDLTHRKRYLNARNTINTLLSWNVIPIINENDTVVVDEIKFGDNDNLSAMITLLMDADILINLTNIDGLYDKDPRIAEDACLISCLTAIGRNIEKAASGIPGALGTGGMLSKVKAGQKVTAAGIPMVIANGLKPDVLADLFKGNDLGTFLIPKTKKLAKRKCWIAFTLKPKGAIVIDNGAQNAILEHGKSLLPIGIVAVEGNFGEGAPVTFKNCDHEILGTGLASYSSHDIRKIMGLKSKEIKSRLGHKPYDEVVHRDNLVVL